jgi:hypothetical protein
MELTWWVANTVSTNALTIKVNIKSYFGTLSNAITIMFDLETHWFMLRRTHKNI